METAARGDIAIVPISPSVLRRKYCTSVRSIKLSNAVRVRWIRMYELIHVRILLVSSTEVSSADSTTMNRTAALSLRSTSPPSYHCQLLLLRNPSRTPPFCPVDGQEANISVAQSTVSRKARKGEPSHTCGFRVCFSIRQATLTSSPFLVSAYLPTERGPLPPPRGNKIVCCSPSPGSSSQRS